MALPPQLPRRTAATILAFGLLQAATLPLTAEEIACPKSDTGISLPKGFCATILADKIGHARQMAVAPNGTVYANTWSGTYYNNDTPHEGGFLVAMKDMTAMAAPTRSSASARHSPRAHTAAPESTSTRTVSMPRRATRSFAIS